MKKTAELSWDEAYAKAKLSLTKLSLSDKVNLTTGTGSGNGVCVGNTRAVQSINYPELCLQDGPLGVREAPHVTAFTPAIQAASTWDLELIGQRAQFLAEEARALGVHVLLAPVCGPLGKIPEDGRAWEGFGSDPYLAGLAVGETVSRMQAVGVQATVKHFIANEQELNRTTMSSNMDDGTMHEVYLWPFYDAVKAGVASIMCSYNRIDGIWACESDDVLNKLAKDHMGFPGYIMTDWGAQHSTALSALAGLDMTMPGSDDASADNAYWGPRLVSAVRNGSVPESRVEDMATRILAAWHKMEQDADYPTTDLSREVAADHASNVRAVARDGIVLLKNEGSILPLAADRGSIAVVGSGAVAGNHSENLCQYNACNDGALGMGWGSGAATYPYFVTPEEAITARAGEEAVTVAGTDDPDSGAQAAGGADLSLVFVTADAGEGLRGFTIEGNEGDRKDLDPWHGGNELVAAVAGASDDVIVVVHSPGPVILTEILSHPSVKAVVWAGLPSSENGNALVDILWGDANPSGKLVYTIAKSSDDYNTAVVDGDDDYAEGVNIDYRHFDSADIEPAFEFGFGLSYTTFEYGVLSTRQSVTHGPINGPITAGGPADLFEEVLSVTIPVTNTGPVDGAEVAQLYLAYPKGIDQPPKQLRGFDKLYLRAGERGEASFSLRKRDMAFWDQQLEKWVIPTGRFEVLVGSSSRDIRARSDINVV
ncbi:beta-glucosidase [Geosmithia morbida]|uniref:Beta-glucosidase cel3A n=1 Tax=Geosmithia morbida TaxID=1094350 RepID=A0A9P5D751_9HYPO|nr:beta-glucosidase [Geosmithia morbida]KAF4125435.1 beta-glucosidase [Geosmithia morbida]